MNTKEDQLNLFEQIEEETRETRARKQVQQDYLEWLKTPELTPCGVNPKLNYNVHDGIIHRCETMPEDVYMWRNIVAIHNGGQYWALQPAAEQMDTCPYCGADLCHGEGQRYLRKASGHWYYAKTYREYYRLDEVEYDNM